MFWKNFPEYLQFFENYWWNHYDFLIWYQFWITVENNEFKILDYWMWFKSEDIYKMYW